MAVDSNNSESCLLLHDDRCRPGCNKFIFVSGLTGEKTIYRRRAEKDPEPGTPQIKPKRLRLVVDVSGSMYRFNGYDGRLDRMMEATVLVMEAFEGHETKFLYDIIGHSGETFDHVFVEPGKPPKDNKQRLDIIKVRVVYIQYDEI